MCSSLIPSSALVFKNSSKLQRPGLRCHMSYSQYFQQNLTALGSLLVTILGTILNYRDPEEGSHKKANVDSSSYELGFMVHG